MEDPWANYQAVQPRALLLNSRNDFNRTLNNNPELAKRFLGLETSPNVGLNEISQEQMYFHEKPQHKRMLFEYKTSQCTIYHRDKSCMGFHAPVEARRLPILITSVEWNYYPEVCENAGSCPQGSACRSAHNNTECDYHPLVYKTELCTKKNCKNPQCDFAHGESDLRPGGLFLPEAFIQLKHYKTGKCQDQCPGIAFCRYHHGPFDKRRGNTETYEPVPCANITKDTTFTIMSNCEKGDSCELAHSKFEIWYHPKFYKVYKCLREECKQTLCPFLHEQTQPVIISTEAPPGLAPVKEAGVLMLCSACNVATPKVVVGCGHLVCERCMGENCGACGVLVENLINLRI